MGGGWVGEIKIKAKLSPAKAGVRAELGKKKGWDENFTFSYISREV